MRVPKQLLPYFKGLSKGLLARKPTVNIRFAWEQLLEALFPRDESCGLCRRTTLVAYPYLCTSCLEKLTPIVNPCTTCGRPLVDIKYPCPYCNPSAEPYKQRFLGYMLSGEGRYLMHRYKYGGERHLAVVLSALFVTQLHRQLQESMPNAISKMALPFTAVTSVPSGRKRSAQRGFDHCADLAKEVARTLEIPYIRCMMRITHERAQAESTRAERVSNLEHAFQLDVRDGEIALSKASTLGHHRLLVLDDVLTTGATLEAATAALKAQFPHLVIYEGAIFYTAKVQNASNDENYVDILFESADY